MHRWLLCLTFLLATIWILASPLDVFSNELNVHSYDCRLTLKPAVKLAAGSMTRVNLEWQQKGHDYTRVTIGKETIRIDTLQNEKVTKSWKVEAGVRPGAPLHLTIMRRGEWLGLMRDESVIFHTEAPRGTGEEACITTDTGWTVDDSRVQRLEPVIFADNFMRTADEHGAWTVQEGNWRLQSAWDNDPHVLADRFQNAAYSLNPFAWMGCNPSGPSLCTTGDASWEDYTMSVAVQPAQTGAAGVVVNMPDPHHGLLVRWSAANDRSPGGNQLALYRMDAGTLTPLTTTAGGYVPGQWYQLTVVSSLESLHVLVDGAERLTVPHATPWRGGVGLYAEGKAGVVFDDVTVYGRTLNKELLAANALTEMNRHFTRDRLTMGEWVAPQDDWLPYPAMPRCWLYQFDCYGAHWISLKLRKYSFANGQLWLGLCNDGKTVTSGYRAVVTVAADRKTAYTLYHDNTVLATATGAALSPDEDYTLRFCLDEGCLRLIVDGNTVVEADQVPPLTGLRPLYRAEGAFSNVRNVVVLNHNMLDYTFANAPVDWLTDGAWMPTVRWACSPNWSFLGGWSRGDAVLWHKQRFSGDQSLQAYVAPKMEYPRERAPYDTRFRDFGITICSDGHNPRSGYAVLYGAADKQGYENHRTVLLRNGVEVAAAAVPMKSFMQGGHHEWYALNLRKRGNTVEFAVGRMVILTYTDPAPLTGGVPAIWTSDNGIMVSRVRIFFANPPQPRQDPLVVLDAPWYPEWANVKQPLTLDFPAAWSTTRAPVQLSTTSLAAPAGANTPLTVAGSRVTFTPPARGDYWYQVTASDGKNSSAAFNLSLPAFDPLLQRDDSHALLLYRFTEGDGASVHDHSPIAPPLDLTIPAGAGVQWLPGHGLRLLKPTIIQSATPAKKLMALADSKACTIEAWVSADTNCPSDEAACLLSWEAVPGQQNFSILHKFYAGGGYMTALVIAPCKSDLNDIANPLPLHLQGFHTGLSHIVITWDGTQTTAYRNGVRMGPVISAEGMGGSFTNLTGPQPLAWHPEDWHADARLILGALSDGHRYFLGTYYLLAIHDTCLSEAQIQRHYQAGPDGL